MVGVRRADWAVSCPYAKNLPRAKLKVNGLISLVEDISQHGNCYFPCVGLHWKEQVGQKEKQNKVWRLNEC